MTSLQQVLDDVRTTLTRVDDPFTPTGCRGWTVHDLVWHGLADLRRGLVALHLPVDGAPDGPTTRVTYWQDWGTPDDPGDTDLRVARILASASPWDEVLTSWDEARRALCHAVEQSDPAQRVQTQGHVIATSDLAHTLAVEAVLHHLDLVEHLEDEGPAEPSLALVREVLDGIVTMRARQAGLDPAPLLAGTATLDDRTWARLGTGRAAADGAQREALGEVVGWLPLFA